ncbi:ATP synthase subunit I [Alishewanella sp. 16-MA]|uniref:ATP synthase subunit I n=1 Tax=Alishewanella maricola TaxID=2795740 RepID=A0ABS8C2P2_9ALTE|nr:ATP synthase subunit I [Alishewanella maricola]MCB5226567.1 ATP synthase subunit I [Alishewanella maricola]
MFFVTPSRAFSEAITVAEPNSQQSRKAAYLLVLFQAVFATLVVLFFLIAADAAAAKSAFKGGLVAVIANFAFAFFAFRHSGADKAELVAASMMRGQSMKVLLTVVLCAVVFQQEQTVAGPFLTGFLLTLLTQWTAPFFFKH